jgi:uncharacterized membrane-anchored protein
LPVALEHLDHHERHPDPAQRDPRRALAKVPELTVYFWIAKVLTTGMGETTSDFLNQRLGPAIAVPIMLLALWGAMRIQFRRDRYHAWTYWLVVVMVAVFGTTAADALHVVLGIPYLYSTAFYLVALAVIFVRWYRSEGTLSVHSIYTRRRERFYWATVLVTFALGTAAGDLTATPLHLGFLTSALMFSGIFLVPAVGYWLFGLHEVAAFWFAYIITRPVGASFADWIAVPRNKGGLAVGPGTISGILAVLIIAFVGYLAVTRKDIRTDHRPIHDEPHIRARPTPEPVD